MGNKHSASSSLSGPILHTLDEIRRMDPSSFDNGRDFCVRFQRTTTNAEVAVGNRNALEMRGTRDCVWIEERGPLKLEIQIIVDGGGEEIRDRVICDSLVENGFLTLQNRRRKAVGGGGSDAGAWISLQIGEPLSLRKEIRYGDRFTFKSPRDVERFETMERKLLEFKDHKLQQHSIQVAVSLDASVLSHFGFENSSDARAFTISYKNNNNSSSSSSSVSSMANGGWFQFITLMSPPAGMKVDESGRPAVSIDVVYLPRDRPLHLRISPFSIINHDSTNDTEDDGDTFTTFEPVTLIHGDSGKAFHCFIENGALRFGRLQE